ncbi:IS66 family transposase [Polymorphobacter sp. PAMC 29334]|uniref:IS66 family transposase n=1 Tax=Polymorphobacter sp. PAMC 29334 TaxID=2862331 RepID=UPI001C74EDAA|nr:IS66 family transposase [Polymorphobacter sp. PAMC 29334]QYE35230.1 IS66 family transposase [Polymorphobacter sp. PAMC 29334]
MEALSPADIIALRQALDEARSDAAVARADAANARAINSDLEARIALQALQIAMLKRDRFGQRSERSRRLIDQMELAFEEAEATAAADEAAAAHAAAKTTTVTAFVRARPSRQPLPAHLPRERVVIPSPPCCAGCGSNRLSKLGEDVTETLEVIPRQWKVIQTVRERFACRACKRVSQPPAPFHVTPRALFGASMLAMLLFEKFGQHQPLNRQRDRYAHEGVDLSLSTLADQVGACTAALKPLHRLIEAHVLAAERLHGDDTTVPVLAKVKTDIGRIWTYVRDDRPFGGPAPPAALFHYSRDRRGEHPRDHLASYTGILQADAYAGYNELFKPGRSAGQVTRALCWAHARRKLFVLADVATQMKRKPDIAPVISPLALEAVARIDRIFDIERAICGKTAEERLAVRQELVTPIVTELEHWLRQQRATLARHNPVAVAINYMLKDWTAFTRFLADGRICLTNNAAERALRGVALGRKSWLFAGSDRGGQRAAFMYSLIVTAKLNDIDPQAWLADVLARIADLPQQRLAELLPWNWRPDTSDVPLAQAA